MEPTFHVCYVARLQRAISGGCTQGCAIGATPGKLPSKRHPVGVRHSKHETGFHCRPAPFAGSCLSACGSLQLACIVVHIVHKVHIVHSSVSYNHSPAPGFRLRGHVTLRATSPQHGWRLGVLGFSHAGSCHAAGYKPAARLALGCAWVFACGVMSRCGLQARSTTGRQALWRSGWKPLPLCR
jgi:hypothetical protein